MQSSSDSPFNSPLFTDLYQFTMAQVYFEQGMDRNACFEFFVRDLPSTRNYLVVAGIKEVVDYLKGFSFTPEDLDFLNATGLFKRRFLSYLGKLRFHGELFAMDEGEIFFPVEPVLQVVAPLPIAQIIETRVMNILQYAILVASKASRIRSVAGTKSLVDFGLRRSHGGEAGLLAARVTYMAGFDGTSTVMAGRLYDIPIFGTMAHSYVQAHKNEIEAFLNFARQYPGRPVLLVDTYDTTAGIKNVIKAQELLSDEGIAIAGIRIDSGNIENECRNARELLDSAGMHHIKIIASGDLDEYRIHELEAMGSPIDGYGVGTRVTTSEDCPLLNCAYKLVEYDGMKTHKRSRGKATLRGRKQVYRLTDENGKIIHDEVLPFEQKRPSSSRGKITELLKPVLKDRVLLRALPSLEEARGLHRRSIKSLSSELLGFSRCSQKVKVKIHRDLYPS